MEMAFLNLEYIQRWDNLLAVVQFGKQGPLKQQLLVLRAGRLQMGQELDLEEIKGRVGSISFWTAFLYWKESLRASMCLVIGARLDALQLGIEEII